MWELVEGKVLFDGTATSNAPYTAEAHLAQMIAVLGEMPRSLLDAGINTNRYFDQQGKLLTPSPFPSCQLDTFSDYPTSEDRADYLDFLKSMLTLAPEERLDASALLTARWLQE
jgi:serine/threonine-protein kinase SRPK3